MEYTQYVQGYLITMVSACYADIHTDCSLVKQYYTSQNIDS